MREPWLSGGGDGLSRMFLRGRAPADMGSCELLPRQTCEVVLQ